MCAHRTASSFESLEQRVLLAATKVPVLVYHTPEVVYSITDTTARAEFVAQMEALKARHFFSITVEEFQAWHDSGTLPARYKGAAADFHPFIAIFDDATLDARAAADAMRDHGGFVGVMAIPTGLVGSDASRYMDWSGVDAIVARGWGVASHTVSHPFLGDGPGFIDSSAVAINGSPTGGTFKLRAVTQDGTVKLTRELSFNASGSAVRNALAAISNVGAGNVTVLGDAPGYNLMFSNALGSVAISTAAVALTGGSNVSITVGGKNQGIYSTFKNTPALINQELANSKKTLEDHFHHEVMGFVHPEDDVTLRTLALAGANGYKVVFGGAYGQQDAQFDTAASNPFNGQLTRVIPLSRVKHKWVLVAKDFAAMLDRALDAVNYPTPVPNYTSMYKDIEGRVVWDGTDDGNNGKDVRFPILKYAYSSTSALESPLYYQKKVNGVLTNRLTKPITTIDIDGNGGADYIELDGALGGTLSGGSGNDTIVGGSLADAIYGNSGQDKLIGGGGADFLSGGSGNDLLYGGADKDNFIGGAGTDRAADFVLNVESQSSVEAIGIA